MVSQVEVANPGFSEALVSLAGLGKAIERSVRKAITVPAIAGSTAVLQGSAPTEQDGGGGLQAGLSPVAFPTPLIELPPIPGLGSLQGLAKAIADALNATLVSELKGIAVSIADCCAQIGDAVTKLMTATGVLESISRTLEACKCQDIGEALKRELEPMKRALRDIMDFGWKDALEWGAIVAGFALSIAAMLEASIPLAILGALAAGAATVGLLMKLNEPTPEEDQESLDKLKEEERARKSRERPIEEAPMHLRRRIEGIRQRDLERRIEEYEEILGRLRRRIQDPEAEGNVVKELDRDDALRALPGAREDYFDLLRQYKGDYWNRSRFNQELRRWLEDVEPGGTIPHGTETPRDEKPRPEGNTPLPDTEDPRHNPIFPRPGDWELWPLPPIAMGGQPSYQLAGLSPATGAEGAGESIRELLEAVLHRLSQPLRIDLVRLEVRLLDDRVIARRLDGNRSVDVDLSRGYRMVGYISV